MKWIKEHKLISMLIVVLIAALTVLGLTFSYGRSGGSILNRLYTILEKPMTGFGNTLKENFKGIFSYRDLLDENDRLKTENTFLCFLMKNLPLKSFLFSLLAISSSPFMPSSSRYALRILTSRYL